MMRILLVATLLQVAASSQPSKLQTVSQIHFASSDPPQPDQPQDFVIYISNFCNSTATLSTQEFNLWEGSYETAPPDSIASQFSPKFKYGFEVKADKASERINGTVLYNDPFVFVNFFSVPHEWGVQVQSPAKTPTVITQADVGVLSVYNILIGQGADC
jgi:hypothetical protein